MTYRDLIQKRLRQSGIGPRLVSETLQAIEDKLPLLDERIGQNADGIVHDYWRAARGKCNEIIREW